MTSPPLLVLSLDYPPNDGGISRLTAGLVEALLSLGQPVQPVTFKHDGRLGLARPTIDPVEVARRRPLRDWGLMQEVWRHLRTHGRQAPILASVWNPEATLAVLAGARRLAILAHGNEVLPYSPRAPKAWLRRFVLERARVVICNSRFTQDLVKAAAPRSHTVVLNPAVDADAFSPDRDKPEARHRLGVEADARILLTVARLDPIKGHETVFRALAELEPQEREAFLYAVVGQGRWRDQLQAQVRDLGLQAYVRFVGSVTDAELTDWYAASDLFLLCSIDDRTHRGVEGFGMALTEAQASGLAVIGTRSGGIPDAVCEGEWLIDEGDSAALARHLRGLLRDPDRFRDQGARCATRVRREMTWPGYAARLLDLV